MFIEGASDGMNILDRSDLIILLLHITQDYLQLNPKTFLSYFFF